MTYPIHCSLCEGAVSSWSSRWHAALTIEGLWLKTTVSVSGDKRVGKTNRQLMQHFCHILLIWFKIHCGGVLRRNCTKPYGPQCIVHLQQECMRDSRLARPNFYVTTGLPMFWNYQYGIVHLCVGMARWSLMDGCLRKDFGLIQAWVSLHLTSNRLLQIQPFLPALNRMKVSHFRGETKTICLQSKVVPFWNALVAAVR